MDNTNYGLHAEFDFFFCSQLRPVHYVVVLLPSPSLPVFVSIPLSPPPVQWHEIVSRTFSEVIAHFTCCILGGGGGGDNDENLNLRSRHYNIIVVRHFYCPKISSLRWLYYIRQTILYFYLIIGYLVHTIILYTNRCTIVCYILAIVQADIIIKHNLLCLFTAIGLGI